MVRENSKASLASSRNSKAAGYRTVGKGSFVDESLFTASKVSPKKEATASPTTIRANASPDKPIEAVSLRQADLARMLSAAPIMSAEEISSKRRELEAKREAERAVSKARKEKMLQLAEEAKKHAPLTESERERHKVDSMTLSKAQEQLDEDLDDAKKMNQMMLYSKCMTIRDQQILEKQQIVAWEEEEQRRLDLEMEVERLKALQMYEAREQQRAAEQRRGRAILEEQLAQRARERELAEEARDQERQAMMRELERLKAEEARAAVEKKQQASVLMEQVKTANAEQIKRKDVLKHYEREEDARIAQYVRQKELREEALAEERERIAHEKEIEVARLRAQQEKAADKQSELDELRARRYTEAKEREWRERERAQAQRASAMQQELNAARAAQQHSRVKQQAEMALMEQDAFQRVLQANQQKQAEEMHNAAAQTEIAKRYKDELLSQIQANEERKRCSRQEHLEEGMRLRQDNERERRRLEDIKERKLKELAAAGVPEKYRTELQRKKISIS